MWKYRYEHAAIIGAAAGIIIVAISGVWMIVYAFVISLWSSHPVVGVSLGVLFTLYLGVLTFSFWEADVRQPLSRLCTLNRST